MLLAVAWVTNSSGGKNVHRHRSVEGIHMLVYCFSHLCKCKVALHGPLRSADFGFIMANMMQHFILPAVWDMVLSEALFGINSGLTAEGKLANTLADRREEGVCLNTLYKLEKIEILTTALLYLFFVCLSGNRGKKTILKRQLNTFFKLVEPFYRVNMKWLRKKKSMRNTKQRFQYLFLLSNNLIIWLSWVIKWFNVAKQICASGMHVGWFVLHEFAILCVKLLLSP